MKNKNIVNVLILFILLILPTIVSGATISGKVFDITLTRIENAVIEINSEPRQLVVSEDGKYSFEVPLGTYSLKAYTDDYSIIENITIKHRGNFSIDLILLPSFEEEDAMRNELDNEDITENLNSLDEKNDLIVYVIALIVIASIYILFLARNKIAKKLKIINIENIENLKQKINLHELPDDSKYLNKIIHILESEGGRASQKTIRKNIPLSEAKISLLITELEESKKIKKIKKGRSNIIILQN